MIAEQTSPGQFKKNESNNMLAVTKLRILRNINQMYS
jgi:hypothetical protein